MSDWQPIETAPENEAVLIYDPYEHFGEGAFLSQSRPECFVAIREGGRWTSDLVEFEYGWASTGSYTVTQELFPTHWMPLPEPPEGSDG